MILVVSNTVSLQSHEETMKQEPAKSFPDLKYGARNIYLLLN